MIVADTDVLIDYLRGKGAHERIKSEIATGQLATTSISVFELLSGARDTANRQKIERLLGALTILDLDEAAACRAAEIRRDLESQGRGSELRRMSEALSPDDELLEPTMTAVGQALTRYTEATLQLEEARTGLGLARTTRDSARENWDRTIDRAYGLLFSELGRTGADRFFPRTSSSSSSDKDEDDGGE